MTLLEDIVKYLTNKGVLEGAGVDAYIDFQPETPDNIVSLHEYKGDSVPMVAGATHRSVQVVIRNKRAIDAQRLAIKVFNALLPSTEDGRVDFTDTRWGQVSFRQTPYKLLQDESDRTHYGFNLGITTELKKEEI